MQDVEGVVVEVCLAREVVRVGRLEGLLHGDHRELGLVEEHQVGVLLLHEVPDVVAEAGRKGELAVHEHLTGAVGREREPRGPFLADGVEGDARGDARAEHRLHDLLTDEGVGAARVEDHRPSRCGQREQVPDDPRRHPPADRAGNGAVDVEQETHGGCPGSRGGDTGAVGGQGLDHGSGRVRQVDGCIRRHEFIMFVRALITGINPLRNRSGFTSG